MFRAVLPATFVAFLSTGAVDAQRSLPVQIVEVVQAQNGSRAILELQDATECVWHPFGPAKLPDPLTMCDMTNFEDLEATLPIETFRNRFEGVTVALLTDSDRFYVVNCEKQRHWWGGKRPCRVPTGSKATATFNGWRVRLTWTQERKAASETFWLTNTLFRPRRK